MHYPQIVQASDFDRYASERDSQAIIPELVDRLVKQSCPNLVTCRIPHGNAVNLPGWDGIVKTDKAFLEFVPSGKSYWEIGTGTNPQAKATKDFLKRTKKLSASKRRESCFVFVTPRSNGWDEARQVAWIKRRQKHEWKQILIIDGVKLADWLREYPSIRNWMITKLGWTVNLGVLSTATEHWENLVFECATEGLSFPPKLFTTGRTDACDALQELFEEKAQTMRLFVESPQDVTDFVSAFLAGLDPDISRIFSNRCLYIKDEQAWRSIVATRSSHVLVADLRLGLETEEGAELLTIARRRGHSVIVPLCGAWSGNNPDILRLRSPSQSEIESVLKEAGYPDIRAKELDLIGADRISALRRYLQGHGTSPPYATWDNASSLAKAGLVGKWDGANSADRVVLETLLGKGYREWVEIMRPDTLRSDSPLIQRDEKWRLVARYEAWDFLGQQITNDDLERFQEIAVSVLGEHDPKFDLPMEERFMANIHGKVLTHSDLIRKGIAETLALIGSRPQALASCSLGKAEVTAVLVIRSLLNKATWERWASLDSNMPLLAEAAPDEFLDAVESVLVDSDSTSFHKIFAEESENVIEESNYMCGLLWALESLAWSPEYLSRVSVILATLASIDPGGNWENRPSNSLVDIFLPWHVQTTAPFEKRKSAIEAVLKEQPAVGWNLLLALLPHSRRSTMGCHQPIWREFIPRDWKDDMLRSAYWEQTTAYANLAVHLAKNDVAKLCELIKGLSDLPKAAYKNLLDHLTTDEVVSLSEEERLPLWENLDALVRNHRKYSDVDWALPEEAVNKIEETAQALALDSPEFKYHYLFGASDSDLYDENEDYNEQQKRLDEARQAAISEILGDSNVDVVLKFAMKVVAPYEVGRALGVIASHVIEAAILPSLLDNEDDILFPVVAGFISTRFWKTETDGIDAVLERGWTPEHKAKFLTLLLFEKEIWERVASYLGETHEALYWKNVRVYPYGKGRALTIAIEKLLKYGREGAAVLCVACTTDDKYRFDESMATRALLAVLESEHGAKELERHQTVRLITHLQESETADQDALFRIEWHFLSWLDEYSNGSPIALEKQLASDPAFFAEAVGSIYRSSHTGEDNSKELGEQKKRRAENIYRLLSEWHRCPGTQDDGSFNADAFDTWVNEARRKTEESGHTVLAQNHIGQILTYAPPEPDGLWIHKAVATILNDHHTGDMRNGFTMALFNQRGMHGFTEGQAERKIANDNREKAEALESNGYIRFATAMREHAKEYDRDAEYEAEHNPYED